MEADPSAENNSAADQDDEGTTSNENFSCYVCLEKFETKSHLALHEIQVHENPQNFKCIDCNQILTSRKSFLNHRKSHRLKKGLHVCEICNKQFKTRIGLGNHILIHTGWRPHECQICHKRFAQRTTLNEHLKIHSGAKPFKCQECGKEFRQSSRLNIHIRTHSKTKTYQCAECEEIFDRKSAFLKHRKSHVNTCNLTFTHRKKPFLKHRNIHLSQRKETKKGPVTCPACNQTFSNPYRLKVHVRQSEFCQKRFRNSYRLIKHKQIHERSKSSYCPKVSETPYSLQRHIIRHENSNKNDEVTEESNQLPEDENEQEKPIIKIEIIDMDPIVVLHRIDTKVSVKSS